MKELLLVLMASGTSDWVTTIDGQIYETPMPSWSQGKSISGCTIHETERWVELHTYDPTDIIYKDGFEE